MAELCKHTDQIFGTVAVPCKAVMGLYLSSELAYQDCLAIETMGPSSSHTIYDMLSTFDSFSTRIAYLGVNAIVLAHCYQ